MEREPLFIVIFGITRNVLRSRDMMLEKTAIATDKVCQFNCVKLDEAWQVSRAQSFMCWQPMGSYV